VVHNRTENRHEIYSYNLYPGPSAKKGLYGAILTKGEREGWITAHCSTVQAVSPYDNTTTFMHEKRCPNPRVILPRNIVPNVIGTAVSVDIRSFGVRTLPTSAENPNYGIIGLFHLLPPALAWLWRLVSPRGHANPSIVGGTGMGSEGVGSYWPFATGKMVHHANMLLEQIINTPLTRFTLVPNQYIGVWKVGFKPQLLMRE